MTIKGGGNYSGFVHADAPLRPEELRRDYDDRVIVAVPGLAAESPVVRRQLSPRSFAVFVDLG